MKKIAFVFAMLTLVLHSNAQDFRKLRLGFGGGYVKARDNGGLVYVEPSYRITDRVAMGLRLETTIVSPLAATNISSSTLNGVYSYSMNGQYYFKSGLLTRPFVGLGAGIYTAFVSGGTSFNDFSPPNSGYPREGLSSGTKLGFYPRAGFDVGHFSFMVEYNIGPVTKYTTIRFDGTTSTTSTTETKRSYFSMKAGFFIGGGRRNK